MEKPEEFHDELASLNLAEGQEERKPLHRNPKFWIPVGIVFIAVIVTIAVTASGSSSNTGSSTSILPGLSDGGSSDGNFDSVPVVSPTTSPRTNPPTMPPTTSPPTVAPVATVVYNPPSTSECQQIAQGQNLPDQSSMVQQSFAVPIDVVLSDDSNIIETTIIRQLQSKLQTKLMPDLAGCSTRRRLRNGSTEIEHHRLLQAAPYVVANAQSEVQAQLVGCKMSNALNCMHVIVNMNLYLKGDEDSNALIRFISDTFSPPEGIVNKLDLEEPVVGLWIHSVAVSVPVVPTPTTSPGSPTQPPASVTIDGITYDEDDDLYDDLFDDVYDDDNTIDDGLRPDEDDDDDGDDDADEDGDDDLADDDED